MYVHYDWRTMCTLLRRKCALSWDIMHTPLKANLHTPLKDICTLLLRTIYNVQWQCAHSSEGYYAHSSEGHMHTPLKNNLHTPLKDMCTLLWRTCAHSSEGQFPWIILGVGWAATFICPGGRGYISLTWSRGGRGFRDVIVWEMGMYSQGKNIVLYTYFFLI